MPKAFLKSRYFKSQKHICNYLCYLDKQSPLFSDRGEELLSEALTAMDQCPDTICWRHVYSMKEEDAARLEIDRDYMKALIQKQKTEIAKALNISPENLILYASFHDVAHHPHIHFITRSKSPSEGYIVCREGQTLGQAFKPCREKIKSCFTNDIFKEDLYHLKVFKSQTRNSLNQQMKQLLEIGQHTHPVDPEISEKMDKLFYALKGVRGRKVYGYLPANIKKMVDDTLQTIIDKDSAINQLFLQYRKCQQNLIDDTYAENKKTVQEKMADWEFSFFHPKKGDDTNRHNLIIHYAINTGRNQRYKKKKAFSNQPSSVNPDSQICISNPIPFHRLSEGTKNSETSQTERKTDFSQTESSHQQHKEDFSYCYKSQNSAIRAMLYHLGYSLHEDKQKLRFAQCYPKPKHQIKKIKKEIQVDQQNYIQPKGL